MQIYVLTTVHNRRDLTLRMLSSLKAQTFKNWRLVLVDDGSQDGTATAVMSSCDSCTVITGNGNLWWAGGLQLAIANLRQLEPAPIDVVLFLNDDQEFPPNFFELSLQAMARHPGALFLPQGYDRKTGLVLEGEGGMHFDAAKFIFTPTSNPAEMNCFSTRALFMEYATLEKVGNFIPHLLPHYLSDYEWTYRAWKKGIKLLTLEEPRLFIHAEQTATRGLSHLGTVQKKIKYLFSNRYPGNPVRMSIFAILHAERAYLPRHLWNIWIAPAISFAKRQLSGARAT